MRSLRCAASSPKRRQRSRGIFAALGGGVWHGLGAKKWAKVIQNRSFGALQRSGATFGGLWDDFGWHLGSLGFQKVAYGHPSGSLWAARGVIWASWGSLLASFGVLWEAFKQFFGGPELHLGTLKTKKATFRDHAFSFSKTTYFVGLGGQM